MLLMHSYFWWMHFQNESFITALVAVGKSSDNYPPTYFTLWRPSIHFWRKWLLALTLFAWTGINVCGAAACPGIMRTWRQGETSSMFIQTSSLIQVEAMNFPHVVADLASISLCLGFQLIHVFHLFSHSALRLQVFSSNTCT